MKRSRKVASLSPDCPSIAFGHDKSARHTSSRSTANTQFTQDRSLPTSHPAHGRDILRNTIGLRVSISHWLVAGLRSTRLRHEGRTTSAVVATVARRWAGNFPRSGEAPGLDPTVDTGRQASSLTDGTWRVILHMGMAIERALDCRPPHGALDLTEPQSHGEESWLSQARRVPPRSSVSPRLREDSPGR